MMDSNKPISPDGGAPPALHGVLGIVFCLCGVVVSILTWWFLPEGSYPVILIGIPALPFVWLGWRSFKKAGWVTEGASSDTGQTQAKVGIATWKLLLFGILGIFVLGFIVILFTM